MSERDGSDIDFKIEWILTSQKNDFYSSPKSEFEFKEPFGTGDLSSYGKRFLYA